MEIPASLLALKLMGLDHTMLVAIVKVLQTVSQDTVMETLVDLTAPTEHWPHWPIPANVIVTHSVPQDIALLQALAKIPVLAPKGLDHIMMDVSVHQLLIAYQEVAMEVSVSLIAVQAQAWLTLAHALIILNVHQDFVQMEIPVSLLVHKLTELDLMRQAAIVKMQ
jgi:hypothetical protein